MSANEKAGLSRRHFIRSTAGAFGGITATGVFLQRSSGRLGDTALVSTGALGKGRWTCGTYEAARPLADAWARSLSPLMRAMDVGELPSRVSSVGGAAAQAKAARCSPGAGQASVQPRTTAGVVDDGPERPGHPIERARAASLPTLLVEFPSGAMIVLAPAAHLDTAAMRDDGAVSIEARTAAAMAVLSYRRQRRVTFEDAREHLGLA